MSFHAVSWVLQHSTATLGARLVLIVLAEHAHNDGGESYPSVETIAAEARLSRKAVQSALRRLEGDGAILRDGRSRTGTSVWRVVMDSPDRGGVVATPLYAEPGGVVATPGGVVGDPGGRSSRPGGGVVTTPEPSLGTVLEPSRGGSAREKDEEEGVPDDFPDELRPHARHVYSVLGELARRHGARRVNPRSLAHVLMARPKHPLVEAAHDFAAWAESQPQLRKDVVAGYANWLRKCGPLAATELLPGEVPSGGGGNVTPLRRREHPADARARELRDLQQRMREERESGA